MGRPRKIEVGHRSFMKKNVLRSELRRSMFVVVMYSGEEVVPAGADVEVGGC